MSQCDCMERVNKLLEPTGRYVGASAIDLATGERCGPAYVIETYKIDENKRAKGIKRILTATYCPFCGVKLYGDSAPKPPRSEEEPGKSEEKA